MTEAAAAADAGTGTSDQGTTNTATNTAAPANDTWFDSLAPEEQKWAESKGWPKGDPSKVIGPALKSYRNAEQLISQIKGDPNRIIVMPKDMNNADEVAEFRSKLGVPKDIKEYGLDTDNNPRMKAFAEMAQKSGVTKDNAQAFVKWAEQSVIEEQAAQEAQFVEQSATEMADWKREMGATADQKIQMAKAAYTMFPELKAHSDAMERAMGTKAFMTMMTSIGSKIGEAGSAGAGGGGNGGMTPAAAKQAIQELQLDANKRQALMDESHPGHIAVKNELIRLNQFANG